MATKILVAIDFSEDSERALDQAIQLTRALGAELELVHVETVPPTMPIELAKVEPLHVDIEEAKRMMGAYEGRAAAAGLVTRTHLRVGPVVMALLDAIQQLGPAMIVVGSHGKGRMTRMLLGSVSESLVRRSPVPVLVVPSLARQHAAES